MSLQFAQAQVDPLSDEPLKPVPRQLRPAGRMPAIQVIVVCLAIDFALIMLTTPVGKLANSELTESMALGVLYGVVAAQSAMAAIWLGIVATALYWMLLGLVMLSFIVLALLPTGAPWPSLLIVGWGGLAFTLPFALVRMAGFRIEPTFGRGFAGEPGRFALSRPFAWTFVIAAILGVTQLLSPSVALGLAKVLRYSGVAVTGLATLWAVLCLGSIHHPRLLVPFALLLALGFLEQKAHGLSVAETIGVATAGVFYIATLAGLLAFYRAAGWRLVAGSGRGWLVR